MSIDAVTDLVQRTRAGSSGETGNVDQMRERLTRLAAEFESMLMLQMLKEMRKSGSWDDEDEHKDGFGSQTLLETVDVELSNHLSKGKGFGLAQQLLTAMDRMTKTSESGAGVSAHSIGESLKEVVQPSVMTPSVAPQAEAPHTHQVSESVEPLEMPEGAVTSGFGWRRDPLNGAAKFHQGIDIRAAYGQDIEAAGPGRVIAAGEQGGYGETVVIEHAGGIRTRYAHLSAALVAAGDEVAAGQIVGRAGRSGRVTGTHLHFEVSAPGGKRLDPAIFAGFKAEGMVADSTGGPTPMQETHRDDNTN